MGEITSSVYAAFGTQDGSDFNDALEANPATLTESLTPGADGEIAGLLLGDGSVGVDGSGLNLGLGRNLAPKAVLAGSMGTRPISDLLQVQVVTLTFAVPLCGNRGTVSGTPADAEFEPNDGIVALLHAFRMTLADWSSGVGRVATPDPAAKLVSGVFGMHGVRYKIRDIRGQSASLVLDPGGRPIWTCQLQGILHDVTVASAPTLTYGVLASESPPVVGTPAAGHLYGVSRSLNACTINWSPTITDIGDTESDGGQRTSVDDLVITAACRAWADDANADFDHDQLSATSAGTLTEFSMQVGPTTAAAGVAKGLRVRMPTAEMVKADFDVLDKKGASSYELRAAGAVANSEFELILL